MAIVYQHIRKDTNEVFYVGIGKNENRAYDKTGRNPHWQNIVKKADYYVEIVYRGLQWGLACNMEQYLIESYGRQDKKTGTLCNMTDGGNGRKSSIVSKETRLKISEKNKGKNTWMAGKKMSEETKRKISEKSKGKKMSEDAKIKMSLTRNLENSCGRKKVINIETGEIYISISECIRSTGAKKLFEKLNGSRKNKTPFRYYEKIIN
jgi:hypothetical protein